MTLGEKLKELRAAKGLTQTELADRLGVTQGYVAAMEVGRRTVGTPKLLFVLCDVFEVEPVALRPFIDAFPENPPPARAKKKR